MSAVLKPPPVAYDPVAELVEEFVEIHNRLTPDLDRYEYLKKELAKIANLDPRVGPMVIVGHGHYIDYTAPAQSSVCKLDARNFIRKTKLWEAVTISITEAKKLCSPEQMEDLFYQKAGSRRFRRVR